MRRYRPRARLLTDHARALLARLIVLGCVAAAIALTH